MEIELLRMPTKYTRIIACKYIVAYTGALRALRRFEAISDKSILDRRTQSVGPEGSKTESVALECGVTQKTKDKILSSSITRCAASFE
jgi:hypothetical protein